MRKQLVLLLTIGLLALVGCEAKDAKIDVVDAKEATDETVTTDADAASSEATDELPNDALDASDSSTTSASMISIADEMAAMEEKSLEYENADWDVPQLDMNLQAQEWYTLWDDELNSLWERLSATLSGSQKDEMVADQREWVDCKEKNVIAAGIPVYGGSLQPLLEYSTAKDMTRARAYYLAEQLALVTGESYTIPADIQASFEGAGATVDEAFESLKGSYTTTNCEFHVETVEESDFMADNFAEGTKWVFWYTRGGVFTEDNLYAYTDKVLVFRSESLYYVIEEAYSGDGVVVSYGEELDDMQTLE